MFEGIPTYPDSSGGGKLLINTKLIFFILRPLQLVL